MLLTHLFLNYFLCLSNLLSIKEPYESSSALPSTANENMHNEITTVYSTAMVLQQKMESTLKKNLAAVVAGSLVGGICIVAATIFICLKCRKYRHQKRLSYGKMNHFYEFYFSSFHSFPFENKVVH